MLLTSDVLKVVKNLNLKKVLNVILPRNTVDGLDLNGSSETALVCSEKVEQRDIAGKRGSYVAHPAQLGGN